MNKFLLNDHTLTNKHLNKRTFLIMIGDVIKWNQTN